MGCHILLKTAFELRQIRLVHTQSGSELMSSEVRQQVPTRIDGGVDIEITYRTGTTADDVIIPCRQYDSRSVPSLRQPAGCDTYDPFMPFRREDHGREPLCVMRILCQLLQSFVSGLRIKIPTVLVIRIDILRKAQSGFCIVGDEQPNGFRSALDTSRCIDTRTDLIDEVTDRNGLAFYPRHFHDGLQSHRRLRIDSTQSVESQDAVLSRHRYDIAGDRHGE